MIPVSTKVLLHFSRGGEGFLQAPGVQEFSVTSPKLKENLCRLNVLFEAPIAIDRKA